jgi:hypothetical protein
MQPERHPNPDRSPEALEVRLRALPPPTVPADLEARLLAAIPPQRPLPQWRSVVWVSVVGALAAACLLVVLAWQGRGVKAPVPIPEKNEFARKAPTRPQDDPAGIAAWLEGTETPTFTWPLEETSPTTASISIPPDLLD